MIDPLPQVGGDFPPRHPDGSVVITPRLTEGWSDFDEWHYNTRGVQWLVYRKVRTVFWVRGHEERVYDTWSMEDAQALARELRFQHPEWPDEFIANRVYSRAIDRFRREDALDFSELPDESDDGYTGWSSNGRGGRMNQEDNPYTSSEPVPQVLSEGTSAWIKYHLSNKAAEAVRLWAEDGLTQDEAARKVGLRRLAVTRALTKLREQASDLRKDT